MNIPNIPHPEHPTSWTFHISNIPHPEHPTSPTSHIPNIPHPEHPTSWTFHIPNTAHPQHLTSSTSTSPISYKPNIPHSISQVAQEQRKAKKKCNQKILLIKEQKNPTKSSTKRSIILSIYSTELTKLKSLIKFINHLLILLGQSLEPKPPQPEPQP